MEAYKVEESCTFIEALFRSERFDVFPLCEAPFRTAFSSEIDDRRNKDWYSAEEEQKLDSEGSVCWGEARELVFQVIRGKKAPRAFHLVLYSNRQESTASLAESGSRLHPEEVSGFYWNSRHEEKTLRLVSGVSVMIPSGDKALEQPWDQATVARPRAMGLVTSEL